MPNRKKSILCDCHLWIYRRASTRPRNTQRQSDNPNYPDLAKFDIVLLYTAVADMVLKPGLADRLALLIMALVVAGAAFLFLRPLRRSATRAA